MTIDFRHVLCPVDYSEFSRRALEHAVAIAQWYEAEITAMHVYHRAAPVAAVTPAMPAPELQADLGVLVDEAHAHLRELVQPAVAAGVQVHPVIAAGHPASAILDRAREWPADLIVMGTHGRSGFERLFLGSVTEKVLRKAPCPVLTVPRTATEVAVDQPVLLKQLLCPVDFSDASLKALEFALSLARESDALLTLVHVLEAPEEEPSLHAHFNVPEYHRLMEELARERLAKLLPADASTWCQPEPVIMKGKAYRGILEAARDRQADLIVMGVLGRNPLDVMLFGSTTHHVVREASCPVLTIRARTT